MIFAFTTALDFRKVAKFRLWSRLQRASVISADAAEIA